MAVPFDLDRLEVRGAPVMVLQGISWRIIGAGEFDFSRKGTLVYQPTDPEANLNSLQWLDASGSTRPALL